MFTYYYEKERFVLDTISNINNFIGACSLYLYLFKNKPYKLDDYFKFQKIEEGLCVSFKKNSPLRKLLAYEMLTSLLITYSNIIRIGGMVIETRVCRRAKKVFQKDTHQETVLFPMPIDIISLHPEKYVIVDLPYREAAKLLLAQEYCEPLVHPDYYTVRVEPRNIESFILV